jgi:hypothetical protein
MKKKLKLGPEGLEIENDSGKVVFAIYCSNGTPVMDFTNPETNHRFKISVGNSGDFQMKWAEGETIRAVLSADGLFLYGNGDEGVTVVNVKSRKSYKFPKK